MRCFIVRPFGIKNGLNFDDVEAKLIRPGLVRFGIEGVTTQVFAQAGNIRTDMFEQLMRADLVVADISIHNANVYYELGVRHALRDRHTILIRCKRHEVPFDLKTDRYLEYPKGDPAAALPQFEEAVRQTLASTTVDSPVFLMVPSLKSQDPEELLPAPAPFVEEVLKARKQLDRTLLGLLGEEIGQLEWAVQGWRIVGRAQLDIKDYVGARESWNRVRTRKPNDVEANLKLATVYQRLGDQVESTAAIERALTSTGLSNEKRAEAQALVGSNLKSLWTQEWHGAAPAERASVALRSGYLRQAGEAYRRGFSEDVNHFYSGLNALALARVTLELAGRLPHDWAAHYPTPGEAQSALVELQSQTLELQYAVRQSLEAAAERNRRLGEFDIWRELSVADLALLTSDNPSFVRTRYAAARAHLAAVASSQAFPADSAARQIRLYLELGVLEANCHAALAELAVPAQEALPSPPVARRRVVVFAGHRIDAEGRNTPRFPGSQTTAVERAILRLLEEERRLAQSAIEGVAGGASGGDILFHEACEKLGIPSKVMLALPPDQYVVQSVQDGGAEWVERFRKLCQRVRPLVLGDSLELPSWLNDITGYSIWMRNNLWILSDALTRDNTDVSLLMVWNPSQSADGPGGTEDMKKLALKRGVKVLPAIDPMNPDAG